MREEIYKNIIGFGGYEVSNFGNVRTKSGKTTVRSDGVKREWKQRVLKTQINQKGYYIVKMYVNGKQYTRTVHRIEMLAFYPETEKEVINHIDGNKLNNDLNNLEWCTYTDNLEHAFQTGLNQTPKNILLKKGNEEHVFLSMARASKWLGYNHGYISGVLKKGETVINGYNIIVTNEN